MYCLKITHWNYFKLTLARSEELQLFLKESQPDIMSIQETKLNDESANLLMRYKGYSMYHKERTKNPSYGGGIAILIKEGITHYLIDKETLPGEVLAINVEHGKTSFNFASMYNPPNITLDKDAIRELLNREDKLIGDLNACTESIGCKRNNESGRVLEELLLDEEMIVCNNQNPTYFTFKPENGYSELLDLLITTANFSNRMIRFQTLTNYTMCSDHCPISCYIKLNDKPIVPSQVPHTRFNLGKADWEKFQNYLDVRSSSYCDLHDENLSPQILNMRVTEDILKAAEFAIPMVKPNTGKELPENVIHMIKQRKAIFKNLKGNPNTFLRTSYNKLTSEIRKTISEFKKEKWMKFIDKHGNHPVSARPFWNEINKAKDQKSSNTFPSLKFQNEIAINDKQKADLFASILKQTFSSSFQANDFDRKHMDQEEKKLE